MTPTIFRDEYGETRRVWYAVAIGVILALLVIGVAVISGIRQSRADGEEQASQEQMADEGNQTGRDADVEMTSDDQSAEMAEPLVGTWLLDADKLGIVGDEAVEEIARDLKDWAVLTKHDDGPAKALGSVTNGGAVEEVNVQMADGTKARGTFGLGHWNFEEASEGDGTTGKASTATAAAGGIMHLTETARLTTALGTNCASMLVDVWDGYARSNQLASSDIAYISTTSIEVKDGSVTFVVSSPTAADSDETVDVRATYSVSADTLSFEAA